MQAQLYDFKSELRAFSKESLNLYRSFGRLSHIAFKALKRIVEGIAFVMLSEPRLYKKIDPGRHEEAKRASDDYLGMHPPSWMKGI